MAARLSRRRRGLLHGLAASAAAGALPGCGFALRGSERFGFQRLALVGFRVDSALRALLRRKVEARAGLQLVPTPEAAEVVLEAMAEARERVVVASTASAQVRELQLRSRLQFRVRAPAGRELLPPAELLQFRDMSYSETLALAKEQEEGLLYRAMEDDIADQVLRRLAAIRLG